MTIRVLVVDDQALVRAGFEMILEAEPDLVVAGEARDGQEAVVQAGTTFEEFFTDARLNPQASLITGVVCGVRVEHVDDPLMQKIRYLDKLVDELASGRAMDKILRA